MFKQMCKQKSSPKKGKVGVAFFSHCKVIIWKYFKFLEIKTVLSSQKLNTSASQGGLEG